MKDTVTLCGWELVFSDKCINSQSGRQPDRLRLSQDPPTQSPPEGAWHILGLLLKSSYTKAYLNVTMALNMLAHVCPHTTMHIDAHTHKLFLSSQSSEKVQSWLCYTGKGRGGFGGQILKLDNPSASLMSLSLLLALH